MAPRFTIDVEMADFESLEGFKSLGLTWYFYKSVAKLSNWRTGWISMQRHLFNLLVFLEWRPYVSGQCFIVQGNKKDSNSYPSCELSLENIVWVLKLLGDWSCRFTYQISTQFSFNQLIQVWVIVEGIISSVDVNLKHYILELHQEKLCILE